MMKSLSLSQSVTTHPQCQCVLYFGFLMTGRIPAQLCRLRALQGAHTKLLLRKKAFLEGLVCS